MANPSSTASPTLKPPACGDGSPEHRAAACGACQGEYRRRRDSKRAAQRQPARGCGANDPAHQARECRACWRAYARRSYREERRQRILAGWRPRAMRRGLCGRDDSEHLTTRCKRCNRARQLTYRSSHAEQINRIRRLRRANTIVTPPTIATSPARRQGPPPEFDEQGALERLAAAWERYDDAVDAILARVGITREEEEPVEDA